MSMRDIGDTNAINTLLAAVNLVLVCPTASSFILHVFHTVIARSPFSLYHRVFDFALVTERVQSTTILQLNVHRPHLAPTR